MDVFSLHDATFEMILNIEVIYIHILRAVLVDWIMIKAYSIFIVSADDDRALILDLQIVQYIFDPDHFLNSFRHGSEFYLSAGLGDNALFFTSPHDQIASKNRAISRH